MAIATSTAVALALAAAAAGIQYHNTRQTNRRTDREMAAGIRARGERQRAADAEVNKLIDRTSQSNSDDARGSMLDRFMEQIRTNQGAATQGLRQAGAVSDAYRQAGEDASLGVTNYATRTADLLSRMDAPLLQRQQEAIDRGRSASNIDQIRRFSEGDDFLNQLRLRGIRRNPWMDAAATMLGSAAGSVGGGGWGSAATAASGATGGTAFGFRSH